MDIFTKNLFWDVDENDLDIQEKASFINELPIIFAEKPDFMALASIWKDRNITLAQLRKEAWGDRQ